MSGFAVRKVDYDDASAPVCCDISDCNNYNLQRVFMAGHPAGILCVLHSRMWSKLWAEFTEADEVKVKNRALVREKASELAA